MNHPGLPAGVHERHASDWQGTRHRYPEVDVDHAGIDLPLQAWLGRLTGQVLPPALAMAWFDRAAHLAFSPNKQANSRCTPARRRYTGCASRPRPPSPTWPDR